MKSEEGDVCHTAEFNDIRSKETVGFIFTGSFDRFNVRLRRADIFGDAQVSVRKIENVFQILRCIRKSQKDIQKDCFVPAFAQGAANAGAGT